MNESKLQREMQKWIKSKGAFVTKLHGNAYQSIGLPDLLVIHKEKTFFIEVKDTGKTLQNNQIIVINEMVKRGGTVLVLDNLNDLKLFWEKSF